MTSQLIGRKNCSQTRKAERFLKERNIVFAFTDLGIKSLSPGEIDKIFSAVGQDLVDTQGKFYKDGGWAWKEFDPKEECRLHPELLKTPILRCDKGILAGFDESAWKEFLLTPKGNGQ
jgi:arsenate reductase-like glutaredoxin family protein